MKVESLAQKLDSLGVQRKQKKKGEKRNLEEVSPDTHGRTCWKASLKKEICDTIDNMQENETRVREKLIEKIKELDKA